MHLHVMDDTGQLNKREDVSNKSDARQKVLALMYAGYRGLTAEVIDDDGEVVASFERGLWKEHAV